MSCINEQDAFNAICMYNKSYQCNPSGGGGVLLVASISGWVGGVY